MATSMANQTATSVVRSPAIPTATGSGWSKVRSTGLDSGSNLVMLMATSMARPMARSMARSMARPMARLKVRSTG